MDEALRDELADVEDRHWWFEGRRRILASVLGDLPLPADASILEMGCGSGGNLALLSGFGSVCACEPDPRDRARALARGLAPVEPGGLPDEIPYEGRLFDLVALLDVLEHVEDDAASLVRLSSRLRPGGHLLVTVPAHPWLWSAHDVRNHHCRRYRLRDLADRIRGAGLVPERLAWFNTFLAPLAVVGRLAGAGRAGTGVPPQAVNRLLAAIFSAEAGAVARSRLPFGISLLAVARRPGTGSDAPRSAPMSS